MIKVGAESSKTVLTKSEALSPPTAENSGIVSPLGATKTAVRPESTDAPDSECNGDVSDLERVARTNAERRIERAGTRCGGGINLLINRGRTEGLRPQDRAFRTLDRHHLAGGEGAGLDGPVEGHVELAAGIVADQIRRSGGVSSRCAHCLGGEQLRAADDQRQGVLVKGWAQDALGRGERNRAP